MRLNKYIILKCVSEHMDDGFTKCLLVFSVSTHLLLLSRIAMATQNVFQNYQDCKSHLLNGKKVQYELFV